MRLTRLSQRPCYAAGVATCGPRAGALGRRLFNNIEGFPSARSGLAWMEAGLHIQLHDFESTVRRIQRVE